VFERRLYNLNRLPKRRGSLDAKQAISGNRTPRIGVRENEGIRQETCRIRRLRYQLFIKQDKKLTDCSETFRASAV